MKLPMKIAKQGQRRLERVEPMSPYVFDQNKSQEEIFRLIPENRKLNDALYFEALKLHYYQMNPHRRDPSFDVSFRKSADNLRKFVQGQKTKSADDVMGAALLEVNDREIEDKLKAAIASMFFNTTPSGVNEAEFNKNMRKRAEWVSSQIDEILGRDQKKKKPELVLEKKKVK